MNSNPAGNPASNAASSLVGGPAGGSPSDLIRRALEQVAALPNDLDRAQAATDLLATILAVNETLREVRRESVLALNEAGWGYGKIGEALGVNKSRVQQIINQSRPARRDGVIATETKIAVARMFGAGAEPEEILETVIPRIREFRGGDAVGEDAIAEMTDLPVATVRAWLAANPDYATH